MELNHVFIGDPFSKRIIVFLHEGLGSVEQWRNFPALICSETKSYGLVYDRRGYGKSKGSLQNRSIDYLEQGAAELYGVIESIVPAHYQLFIYGHSDGGSIALIYAALHPSKITGLIAEAAHVFVEPETIEGVQAALPFFNRGKFDGLKKYHGARFREVFMAWNKIWLNPKFKDWNICPLLPLISCPQLIIQGENDQYGTLLQVNKIVYLTKGKSHTYIPKDCNHAPHKENEQGTLQRVLHFINALNESE